MLPARSEADQYEEPVKFRLESGTKKSVAPSSKFSEDNGPNAPPSARGSTIDSQNAVLPVTGGANSGVNAHPDHFLCYTTVS